MTQEKYTEAVSIVTEIKRLEEHKEKVERCSGFSLALKDSYTLVYLDPRLMVIERQAFVDCYISKIKDEIKRLETEFENL